MFLSLIPQVVIYELLKIIQKRRQSLFMQELVLKNNNLVLNFKSLNFKQTIQNTPLSLILPLLSTFNVKDLRQFWNQQCQELQQKLWLPMVIDSPVLGSDSYNGLSNYLEEKLNPFMTRLKPKDSINESLSVLLPASAIPTMENGQQIVRNGKEAIISKKIRIYPENKEAYKDGFDLNRRAWNLAVEHIKEDFDNFIENYLEIRKKIKDICRLETEATEKHFAANLCDEVVDSAKAKQFEIMKENKRKKENGEKNYGEIGFKKAKSNGQYFLIPRLAVKGIPYPRMFGKVHITEKIPEEAINSKAIVTVKNGRIFLSVKKFYTTHADSQGIVGIVSLDPGVRTFQTGYSLTEGIIVGDKFSKDILYPLMKEVDKLLKEENKILEKRELNQRDNDRLIYIERKINQLKNRKNDLVEDLHRRLAYYLVSNYDVVYLPKFETQKMVIKSGGRQIRRKTAREMLNLKHYKFQTFLEWMARKYGKHLVICNESYTSKTRTWDGFLMEKLGGKKVIKGEGFKCDRDICGTRNILIKQLTSF